MSLWISSSQKSSWIFTTQKLEEIRLKTYHDCVQKYSNINFDVDLEGQKKILLSYERKIQQICIRIKFNTTCTASSLIFFKRFFLNNTIFENDINYIM